MIDIMSQIDTDSWENFLDWLVDDKKKSGKVIVDVVKKPHHYQHYWDEFEKHMEEL